MREVHLGDDFNDSAAERSLTAAVLHAPELIEELQSLPAAAFGEESATWNAVRAALQEGSQYSGPAMQWQRTTEPTDVARQLVTNFHKPILAEHLEDMAKELYGQPEIGPVLAKVEAAAAQMRILIGEPVIPRVLIGSDLVDKVLADADMRVQTRIRTGKPCMGLSTSIVRLDELLGGLEAGLLILGGPPGMGKTSLALQIALNVARETPVVYVTFENSAFNLATKALAARAGVKPKDIRRGYADLDLLVRAAEDSRHVNNRVAFAEGTSRFSIPEVRTIAREMMSRHNAQQCLIIIDYLQLAAKCSAEVRKLPTLRERVETMGARLRELAMEMNSPILCLSSQNRASGNYSKDQGSAALDSLKESGDLEYGADVVLFLTGTAAAERLVPFSNRALDLTIAKHRNGEVGRIEMVFMPETGILRETRHA
jgi:replicative DNA helicase